MVMLILHSRRPRRWAGVALFAAMLTLPWWMEPHETQALQRVAPPAEAQEAAGLWDDHTAALFTHPPVDESLLPLLAPSRAAQFTAVPGKDAVSFGAAPIR